MSVLVVDASDALTATANIVQGNSNFSFCAWVYVESSGTGGDYQNLWIKQNAGATAWIELITYDTAGTLTLELSADNGPSSALTDTAIPYDTWLFVGVRKSGNTHGLILNNAQTGTFALNMTGVVFTTELIGFDGTSVNGFSMRAYREWSADIASGNFTAEGKSSVVVRTSNLLRNTPFIADALDISGNGNDWTNTGCAFDATTPYPAVNVDPTNAVSVSLSPSYSQVVNANPSSLFAFDLWWTVAGPTAGLFVLSIFGRSNNYAGNSTDVDFWETASATTGASTSSENNYPIIGYIRGAVTHYISATPSSRTAAPYTVTMEMASAPDTDAPVAAIFSNDDQRDLPAVLLSSTTDYEVFRYADIPAGESGDILLNGRFLIGDRYTPQMSLYDAEFNLLASFTGAHGGNHSRGIRANRLTSKFYFVRNGQSMLDAIIDRVDGIAIDLTFTLTGAATGISLGSIMPNLADTVLYHAAATSNQPIEAWDIPGNAALSNAVAGVASQSVIDMLALADGTFAVLRQGTTNAFLYQYDSAWSLLNTWDLGASTTGGVPSRMTWALDDPNSVWVKIFRTDLGDPILSEGRNVKLSDGTTISSVFHATFFDGAYTPELFDGSTPVALYGWPSSCPFFLFPLDSPVPPTPPIGESEVTEFPIRRLRRSPHTTLEQLRIAIHRVQVDLQPGIGTETGIGIDPRVLFRYSHDGGRTWSDERRMSAGALGRYLARAQTYRLGQGRDWVFEAVVSDPNVPWVLVDLIFDPSPGSN